MNRRRYDADVPRLETLHVAALPYPTTQGTQAAVGCMVAALAGLGRETALLTYESGIGHETRFEHRTTSGGVRPRSLRSGPSLEKLAADVTLARALRTQAADADVVVAHHVEAATICAALRIPRWIFVAHTTLGPELPTYLPGALAPIARRAGTALDRRLARTAPGLAAISPHVARELARIAGRDAVVLPTPIPRATRAVPRADARRALGLADADAVVLYAGNLDAYQGLPTLVHAMRELAATRPRTRLLVATESASASFRGALERAGAEAHFAPLSHEDDRARAHAAADVAVVTRGTAGGFPIKLLDAVAREVPVVAMRRSMSGVEFPGVRVAGDDPLELARALRGALDATPAERGASVAAALAHLVHAHGASALAEALDTAVRRTHVGPR